jgi:hypothetical protein
MALLELALKNIETAQDLLVEAAREYANLAQLESIERVYERLAKIVGSEPWPRIPSRGFSTARGSACVPCAHWQTFPFSKVFPSDSSLKWNTTPRT